ncbi:MAG TPA: cytochrome P450, partial [Opitutaceae bacterium]
GDNPWPMPPFLSDTIGTLRALHLARDNMVAAWPVSFYRREFISEKIFGRRIFIVNCPAGVQHVFVTNSRNYRKSPANSATLTPLLGRGLFVSEGELWNRQRKVMTPAVGHSRLADYARIVIAAGTETLQGWAAKGPAAFEVDVNEPFTLLTAEVISQIMFGYRLGPQGWTLYDAFKDYQASAGRVHMAELIGLPDWFPRPGRRRGRKAVEKFDSVLLDIIETGRRRGVEAPDDLLNMLLSFRDEAGRPMATDLVRDEVASIFLAGHETTAITLSWAFYLLDRHPAVESLVHDEVDRVFAGRAPEYADLEKLTYCRAVIDETLRLFPPVHVFSRQALADDVVCGQRVPRGSFITVASWVLHRHKLFWQQPEEFRPERFLPENADKVDRFAYIPFGTGPRVCLGKHLGLLEATLLFAMTARGFRLRLKPGASVEPLGRMTLRPRWGMPMVVESRRSPP